jgi:hypothetical protein
MRKATLVVHLESTVDRVSPKAILVDFYSETDSFRKQLKTLQCTYLALVISDFQVGLDLVQGFAQRHLPS